MGLLSTLNLVWPRILCSSTVLLGLFLFYEEGARCSMQAYRTQPHAADEVHLGHNYTLHGEMPNFS